MRKAGCRARPKKESCRKNRLYNQNSAESHHQETTFTLLPDKNDSKFPIAISKSLFLLS